MRIVREFHSVWRVSGHPASIVYDTFASTRYNVAHIVLIITNLVSS